MQDTTLTLPMAVVGKVDVGRLLREIEVVDTFIEQANVRTPGDALAVPKTSRMLEDMAKQNGLNLLQDKDRQRLAQFLTDVRLRAPVIHMSVAADPSPVFVHKMTEWFRREIHPLALVQFGLQPSIAAGCIIRTTNKYFDFSLRKHLLAQRELLIEKIQGSRG